jgi:hypothetical protein
MAQSYDLYRQIEGWWGEELSEDLIGRVARSPRTTVRQFLDDVDTARPESYAVPDLAPGLLRPLLIHSVSESYIGVDKLGHLDLAFTLLLYAHEVLIEDPILTAGEENLTRALAKLLALKPLAEAGVVHFLAGPMWQIRHPSRAHEFVSLAGKDADEVVRELAEILPSLPMSREKWGNYTFSLRSDIGAALRFAIEHPGRLNLLTRQRDQGLLLKHGLENAGVRNSDLRYSTMCKLAALNVPDISADPRSLIILRDSATEFADWRAALASALTQVQNIGSDNAEWRRSASAVITAELEPYRVKIGREVSRSAFLESVTTGMKSFAFTAIGTSAGMAAGGKILPGLTGAAVGKSTELATAYIGAVKKRKKARAIYDLTLSFSDTEGEERNS